MVNAQDPIPVYIEPFVHNNDINLDDYFRWDTDLVLVIVLSCICLYITVILSMHQKSFCECPTKTILL